MMLVLNAGNMKSRCSVVFRWNGTNTHFCECWKLVIFVHATCFTHLSASISLHSYAIMWRVIIIKLSLCSFLGPTTPSTCLGPNVLSYVPFSNTLSLPSHILRQQVSNPYKTTGSVILRVFTFNGVNLNNGRLGHMCYVTVIQSYLVCPWKSELWI
jgi:hypothetical protein